MVLTNQELAALRQDYRLQSLDFSEVATTPLQQFERWFKEAIAAEILEPNAMTLATVGADGCPSARIVLLKGIENEAFTFFTNYNSKKGQDINGNSNVALVFNWLDLQRQVRIKGVAEKVSAAASTAYFQSRPKGSQIGAWVSAQSEVIAGRVALEERYKELEEQFKMETVLPRPEHWGGYAVYPEEVEFWQGRSSRLHDRIRYTKQGNDWIKERLAP